MGKEALQLRVRAVAEPGTSILGGMAPDSDSAQGGGRAGALSEPRQI